MIVIEELTDQMVEDLILSKHENEWVRNKEVDFIVALGLIILGGIMAPQPKHMYSHIDGLTEAFKKINRRRRRSRGKNQKRSCKRRIRGDRKTC